MMNPTTWTNGERRRFIESVQDEKTTLQFKVAALTAELRDCRDLCREQAEMIVTLKAQLARLK
jgi:hypothetical protein